MSGVALSKHPPKRSRAEWYADVKRMKDRGMSGLAIARELGISHSFLYSLLNDPDGSKDRERKRGYAGTCVDCGAETYGGAGHDNAPERCADCHLEYMKATYRYWTRERIIAAIQRFAREHGRPPLATDWNHAGRGDGYPPTVAVYRTKANPHHPFASWAEAIEAAGFPRPQVGKHHRTGHVQLKDAARYALKRAKERPKSGITTRLLADERGTSIDSAQTNVNNLVRRGLLVRVGKIPNPKFGGPLYVYKLSSDGASAPERTKP